MLGIAFSEERLRENNELYSLGSTPVMLLVNSHNRTKHNATNEIQIILPNDGEIIFMLQLLLKVSIMVTLIILDIKGKRIYVEIMQLITSQGYQSSRC